MRGSGLLRAAHIIVICGYAILELGGVKQLWLVTADPFTKFELAKTVLPAPKSAAPMGMDGQASGSVLDPGMGPPSGCVLVMATRPSVSGRAPRFHPPYGARSSAHAPGKNG